MEPVSQTPPVPPQPPAATAPVSTPPVIVRPKGAKTVIIAALVLTLVLGGGGFAYALYSGKISLPFLAKEPTLEEMANTLVTIKSARVGTDLTVGTEERDFTIGEVDVEKLTAPPKKEGEDEESGGLNINIAQILLAAFPADASGRFSTTTDWTGAEDRKANTETKISGSFATNGLTVEFGGAMRAVNGTSYVMIDKLPIPTVDFSKISGRWITIGKGTTPFALMTGVAEDESTKVFKSVSAIESAKELEKKRPGMFAELRVLFAELAKDGAIKAKTIDGKADVEGRKAWRIDIGFDPALYRATFKRVHADRATFFPNVEAYDFFTDDRAAQLEGADAAAQFDDLAKNVTLSAFVDKKTRQPFRIAVREPIVLAEKDAPNLAGKQLVLGMTVSVSNVDVPVTIEEPQGALTILQAQKMMSPGSENAVEKDERYDEQRNITKDLGTALSVYHEKNKQYPDKLADLIGLEYDSLADQEGLKGKYLQQVVNVPNDRYTGKPFLYEKKGDGYELKYELGEKPAFSSVDAFSFFVPTFVAGTNTMTPETASVEGDLAAKKDTDGDGLLDTEEQRLKTSPDLTDTDGDGLSDGDEVKEYRTSPKKSDTDGDGFSDGAEVKGGFDPLENAQTMEKAESEDVFF